MFIYLRVSSRGRCHHGSDLKYAIALPDSFSYDCKWAVGNVFLSPEFYNLTQGIFSFLRIAITLQAKDLNGRENGDF